MQRLFHSFSPLSKHFGGSYTAEADSSLGMHTPVRGVSREEADGGQEEEGEKVPLALSSHDAGPFASSLTRAGPDSDRKAMLSRMCERRITDAVEQLCALLPIQNPPSNVDEFVSSLSDGSYVVGVLQLITGVVQRPNKLAALGNPGITPENFDRIGMLCDIAHIRTDVVLTQSDIESHNIGKIALFMEEMVSAANRASLAGELSHTPGMNPSKMRKLGRGMTGDVRSAGAVAGLGASADASVGAGAGTGCASAASGVGSSVGIRMPAGLSALMPPSPSCIDNQRVLSHSALFHHSAVPRTPSATGSAPVPSTPSGAFSGAGAVAGARSLLSPTAAPSLGSMLQGIANIEEKKMLASEKFALEKKISALTEELSSVRSGRDKLEKQQADMQRSLTMLSDTISKTEERCARKERELAEKEGTISGLLVQFESDTLNWKHTIDAKAEREADLREELKRERASLAQLRVQLEESAVRADQWNLLHEELALRNSEVAELEERLETGRKELERLAATPNIVTETVTVVKEVRVPEDPALIAARATSLTHSLVTARRVKSHMTSLSQELARTFQTAAAEFAEFKQHVTNAVCHLQEQARSANERFLVEQRERRRLHNTVCELKGNIRVFARVRPANREELSSGDKIGLSAVSATELHVVSVPESEVTGSKATKKPATMFEFDQVFGSNSTQQQVFAEIQPIVISALDGYHACIFAYGQTGAGKSYTMTGPSGDRGVNHRTLHALFHETASRAEACAYTFKLSMLEIYNENVIDLLTPASTGSSPEERSLDIRQGLFGLHVPDAASESVSAIEEVEALMLRGEHNRTTAHTNCNEHSSRSHSLIMIDIVGVGKLSATRIRGRLVLVDLAGSERVSKSGVTGLRMKEAQSINKSLSALGNVIQSLVTNQAHIPFRDSKLTYLLQDSVGKSNKTVMIVHVSPTLSCRAESLCSLNFANRVQKVELGKAKSSAQSHSAADIEEAAKARAQAGKAKEELAGALAENERLNHQVEGLKRELQSETAKAQAVAEASQQSSTKLQALEQQCASLQRQASAQEAALAQLQTQLAAAKSEAEKAQAQFQAQSQAQSQLHTSEQSMEASVQSRIAAAVAHAQSLAQAEKDAAVAQAVAHAVTSLRQAAQERLDLKRGDKARQERLSIITPTNSNTLATTVSKPIVCAPPPLPLAQQLAAVSRCETTVAPTLVPTAQGSLLAPSPLSSTAAVPLPVARAVTAVAFPVSVAAPAPKQHSGTPFRVAHPTAIAEVEDEEDESVADRVGAEVVPRSRIPLRGGTPAKPKQRSASFDDSDVTEDDGASLGDGSDTEQWASGTDVFQGGCTPGFLSSGAGVATGAGPMPAGILKLVPSRMQSLRSIARSLSTVGLPKPAPACETGADGVPDSAFAGTGLPVAGAADTGSSGAAKAKKVTFVSPAPKRQRDETTVSTDALAESSRTHTMSAAPPSSAHGPVPRQTVFPSAADSSASDENARRFALLTPSVCATTVRVTTKKKIKILSGGAERVLTTTPKRQPAAALVPLKASARATEPMTSQALAAAAASGKWKL